MKKLLLILFVALLQSCATVYHEAVYSIDFRDYVEKGFMISPTDTGFDLPLWLSWRLIFI